MPTGIRPENFLGSLPLLPLVVLGTAPAGLLGKTLIYDTQEAVLDSFGGKSVARIPQPQSISTLTFPQTFYPDDESLTTPSPSIYHCPPSQTYAVFYPYLTSLSGSSFPVTAKFDPTGYDPSVLVAPGGLFLEAESAYSPDEKALFASGTPTGGLIIPLLAALSEAQEPVAGIRVGSSWLPFRPPTIALPCGVSLNIVGQGSNDAFDRFLTPYALFTADSLILDPGLLGLPFIRKTYSLHTTWEVLISHIFSDSQAGYIPFIPSTNGPNTAISVSPGTFFSSYLDPGTAPLDLTLASSWAAILETESLDVEDYPLVCCSGLTGLALSNDPASATRILTALTGHILIVPWTLTYSAPDASAIAAQVSHLVLAAPLSQSLVITWGHAAAADLPRYRSQNIVLPVAYAAAGAISRESASGNPCRPTLNSLLSYSLESYDFASGLVTSAIPNKSSLETLRLAGIMPLTRGMSGLTLHGPLTVLDGTMLNRTLCVSGLQEAIIVGFDSYLGLPDSPFTRVQLQEVLDSLLFYYAQSALGSFALELTGKVLDAVTPGVVTISGSLQLYGELRSIAFQISLQQRG